MKKWFLTALAVMLLAFPFTGAFAADEGDGEFPLLNGDGFLDEGEFLFEDADAGVWRYANSTIRVEVLRKESEKPKEVWYEAEIWCAEGSSDGVRVISANPEKWAYSEQYPYKLARKTGTVIAMSCDYAGARVREKSKVGIVIRNGEIKSEKTYKSGSDHFPNLDILAIYEDGDMKVFESNEKTAEELLEEGAVDVMAFGPILIKDGELNEKAIEKYGKSTAQRAAVGMAEKGHYFFMMLEGRIDRSKGAGIHFLAERLLERGCTVGFNLDGGQTASIVFMGHQLCKMDNKNRNLSSRKACDILGAGYSELLPAVSDPW